MKKKVLAGVFVAVASLVALASTVVPAQAGPRLWSVAVHIEYPDGFVYDHAFATGVATADLPAYLRDCGSSHAGGSWLQFHCYAIPE